MSIWTIFEYTAYAILISALIMVIAFFYVQWARRMWKDPFDTFPDVEDVESHQEWVRRTSALLREGIQDAVKEGQEVEQKDSMRRNKPTFRQFCDVKDSKKQAKGKKGKLFDHSVYED